jgi:hypothetical protein
VELPGRIDAALADAVLDDLANDEQLALERARRQAAPRHVDLPKYRRDFAGGAAGLGFVDRDIAPADEALAFLGDDLRDDGLASGARRVVSRQEQLADAVAAPARHVEPELEPFALEEAVRQLH